MRWKKYQKWKLNVRQEKINRGIIEQVNLLVYSFSVMGFICLYYYFKVSHDKKRKSYHKRMLEILLK